MLVAATILALATAQSEPEGPEARAVYVPPDVLVVDGDPSEWRGPEAPDVVIERVERITE